MQSRGSHVYAGDSGLQISKDEQTVSSPWVYFSCPTIRWKSRRSCLSLPFTFSAKAFPRFTVLVYVQAGRANTQFLRCSLYPASPGCQKNIPPPLQQRGQQVMISVSLSRIPIDKSHYLCPCAGIVWRKYRIRCACCNSTFQGPQDRIPVTASFRHIRKWI